MTDREYYLITTADELTWKFDRPVIFLGEWCCLFSRMSLWGKMDAIIAKPYGLGEAKKDADQAESRALEAKIFAILCETLNSHHKINHSERFWNIVLGHWFRRYVNVMLNRVRTLEQCFNTYKICGTTFFTEDSLNLAPTDSYAAILAFNNDRWNNKLNARIINLLGLLTSSIEIIDSAKISCFHFIELNKKISLKSKFNIWVRRQIKKSLAWFVKNEDAVIVSTYLPKLEQVKLYISLRQFPQLYFSERFQVHENANPSLRQELADKITEKSSCKNLEDVIRAMLFELLPICYLEGFKTLNESIAKDKLPKFPKFIFTSNNFDKDETFKLWAAKKVESGVKYIVGQHGGSYGSDKYSHFETIEEVTANKFLTWGWCDGLKQQIPGFMLTTVGNKLKSYNRNGGLLLIELHLNHRMTTWDDTHEFANYFSQQKRFVELLNKLPRQNLTIRLHSSYRYLTWNEEERWMLFDSTLKINKGDIAISKLISKSRLVVHSYNSTGLLETLASNIPTLAFWQNNFEHLRESARPYYQLLVDVGILHLTPESLAQKVNQDWGGVEDWWGRNDVQDARKKFCEQYAKTIQNPSVQLKKLLLNEN